MYKIVTVFLVTDYRFKTVTLCLLRFLSIMLQLDMYKKKILLNNGAACCGWFQFHWITPWVSTPFVQSNSTSASKASPGSPSCLSACQRCYCTCSASCVVLERVHILVVDNICITISISQDKNVHIKNVHIKPIWFDQNVKVRKKTEDILLQQL